MFCFSCSWWMQRLLKVLKTTMMYTMKKQLWRISALRILILKVGKQMCILDRNWWKLEVFINKHQKRLGFLCAEWKCYHILVTIWNVTKCYSGRKNINIYTNCKNCVVLSRVLVKNHKVVQGFPEEMTQFSFDQFRSCWCVFGWDLSFDQVPTATLFVSVTVRCLSLGRVLVLIIKNG